MLIAFRSRLRSMGTGSVSHHVLACGSFICSLMESMKIVNMKEDKAAFGFSTESLVRDMLRDKMRRARLVNELHVAFCIFKRQVTTEGVYHTSQKSEAVTFASC